MFVASIINDGDFTKTIYSLIKDNRFGEAIRVLHGISESNSTRAGLSLLAYCYFYTQDYANASSYYEQLTKMYPSNNDYKLYHAQSLFQACQYEDAYQILNEIKDIEEYKNSANKLQAAIKYSQDDLLSAKELVESCKAEDPDREVNIGCIFYKDGNYEEALSKFSAAMQMQGFKPYLAYNIALCYYRLKDYALSLKYCADIIENGIRDHPEMSIGMQTEGIEVRSVGNTLTLHETALTEAFNLKAAIEYQSKNIEAAREALTDMPPRAEHELDAVTLHNQALMNFETNPTEGFEKLQFLLQQNPFPPETFANLLLLYCQYECYDLAANILAENTHLTYKYLTQYLYDFLDAVITLQTSPNEAYQKFDEIVSRHAELLRKYAKQTQEYRNNNETELVKKTVMEYEDCLEKYIPALMAQAKIYWDLENYQQCEKVFRKSVEFCNDNETWRLNVAHVLFMQENKFKEAAGFYEPLVKKRYSEFLKVNPIILANLCVSYIMTIQNEDAEELMRKVEKEEDQLAYEEPEKKCFHHCIINLVIGTLYCSKGNYEFGISRVMKSLEPYNKKLGTDTWFYTKRCFLSLLEMFAKHMISLKDSTIEECLAFLENCELHGKTVKSVICPKLYEENEGEKADGEETVTYEARKLKCLLLKLQNY
ncbi:tetratricopeptide repeat protein 30A isoform X1 [Coccinella septempunctata]|uniref:tetratricopeptide repeat protein 30A isoform X1 n=1 Tax=Coccinella septempunctata TaxID=41139 RepID=UPI001D066CD6|nr:tetratricopeptide repeat protein 30A isoform X1 [Coccinella septempunctata]XP_044747098.1 tetratricopeptide repeat protein 30A isoform X1 [Coccinella septempunctata]